MRHLLTDLYKHNNNAWAPRFHIPQLGTTQQKDGLPATAPASPAAAAIAAAAAVAASAPAASIATLLPATVAPAAIAAASLGVAAGLAGSPVVHLRTALARE